MIQKTPEEKALLKEAKKAYKAKHGLRKPESREWLLQKEKAGKKIPINNGILPGESILASDFPVWYNLKYVIDDNGGTVISSPISGTVEDLRTVLRTRGCIAENIRECNMSKRNLL